LLPLYRVSRASHVIVPKVLKKVFLPKQQDLAPVILQIVEFAEIARRDGILALEAKTEEIQDPSFCWAYRWQSMALMSS